MNILAIETSCDETAVAVVRVHNGVFDIRSNVVSSQVKLHAKYGGVVPNLAAREHTRNIAHVFSAALEEAGISDFKKEIDLIAVTHGPGLGPSLLVGISFAKTLAWLTDKPIVGVNHLDGHIHSNWLQPVGEISNSQFLISKNIFPALNLVVSGGHTELVLMKDHGDYRIIGETQDDAVGEAFDKVARLLDLGYPGGPAIAKLAQKGDARRFSLPRPMLDSKNFHFSYSGLKTAVLYLIRDLKLAKLPEQTKADIAASFQDAAIDVLIQKTKRAAQKYHSKTLLLSGGVSANELLRRRLEETATELGVRYAQPKMLYTTDNAAMIAAAGYFAFRRIPKKKASWKSVRMNANLTL